MIITWVIDESFQSPLLKWASWTYTTYMHTQCNIFFMLINPIPKFLAIVKHFNEPWCCKIHVHGPLLHAFGKWHCILPKNIYTLVHFAFWIWVLPIFRIYGTTSFNSLFRLTNKLSIKVIHSWSWEKVIGFPTQRPMMWNRFHFMKSQWHYNNCLADMEIIKTVCNVETNNRNLATRAVCHINFNDGCIACPPKKTTYT